MSNWYIVVVEHIVLTRSLNSQPNTLRYTTMLTILLTFILWFALNTIVQRDLKKPQSKKLLDTPTKTDYNKRTRKRYTQEHIRNINLLELLP